MSYNTIATIILLKCMSNKRYNIYFIVRKTASPIVTTTRALLKFICKSPQ